MRLGLSGGDDLFELRKFAEEEIKRQLETIKGVAAVKVKGGLEREIRVELDESQLTLRGLNIRDINRLIGEENINLAGGNLKEGQTEYLVRTLNEFRIIDEISNLVISRINNVEVRIKDLGLVKDTHKDREVITRIGGNESVKFEIFKNLDDESIKKFHCLCIVQHHTKTKSSLEEIYKNSLIPLIYDCQNNLVKDKNSKTLLKFFGDK